MIIYDITPKDDEVIDAEELGKALNELQEVFYQNLIEEGLDVDNLE